MLIIALISNQVGWKFKAVHARVHKDYHDYHYYSIITNKSSSVNKTTLAVICQERNNTLNITLSTDPP